MHYGEVEARSIRGQASAREAVFWRDWDPLPMLAALRKPCGSESQSRPFAYLV
jgi:hypothetical protein